MDTPRCTTKPVLDATQPRHCTVFHILLSDSCIYVKKKKSRQTTKKNPKKKRKREKKEICIILSTHPTLFLAFTAVLHTQECWPRGWRWDSTKKMQSVSSKSCSPSCLWSSGSVLPCSAPPMPRMAGLGTGLAGHCCQRRGGHRAPLFFALVHVLGSCCGGGKCWGCVRGLLFAVLPTENLP